MDEYEAARDALIQATNQFVNPAVVAVHHGCSEKTVYRRYRRGELRGVLLGRNVFIWRGELRQAAS